MADFTLAITAVKSAYDTYINATTAYNEAVGTLEGLGAEPTPPTVVAADTDWNNYVTSLNTWNSSYATAAAAVASAKATQRTAELAVITALGYGTGDTADSIALDQWVRVSGSGGGPLTYTNYIGASTLSTYLVVSTVLPTRAFPNV